MKLSIRNSLKWSALLLMLMLASSHLMAQEKVCIPNVWSPAVVKGKIYTNSGDSLTGKFTHLTPYNDIKTTHILYKLKGGDRGEINRSEIAAYYDDKKKEKRVKIYIDKEKITSKKGCYFDMGKFLIVIRSGKYTLLHDKLNYQSSLESYTQSLDDDVYYIVLENGESVKLILSDLRAQMVSLCDKSEIADYTFPPGKFDIDAAIDLIDYLNKQ